MLESGTKVLPPEEEVAAVRVAPDEDEDEESEAGCEGRVVGVPGSPAAAPPSDAAAAAPACSCINLAILNEEDDAQTHRRNRNSADSQERYSSVCDVRRVGKVRFGILHLNEKRRISCTSISSIVLLACKWVHLEI